MRISVIYLLVFLLFNLPLAGSAETKTHINDAITLMGAHEKQVALGCEALISSSFETEDIDRIQSLANEYNIASLREIVKLRNSRILDTGGKLTNLALGILRENIENKHNGNASYEEIYIRIVQGMVCHGESTRADIYAIAKEKSQRLLEKDCESLMYREIGYISNLLYIANSTDIYGY